MTTAQIQYFLVAAQYCNFTAAAEQLYITQPSLSRQISTIEDELGVKLFIRSNNTVTLTPAGEALYRRLTDIYADYQRTVKEVRDISAGTSGHLNLGVLEDQYMDEILVGEIRALLQENPNCELNISRYDSRSLFSGLMDSSIDVGLMLIYSEFAQFGFEYLELDVSPAQIAVNRHLQAAQRTALSLDELDAFLKEVPLAMVTPNQFPEPLQDSLKHFAPFTGLSDPSSVKLLSAISSVSLYVAAGLASTLTNNGNLLKNDPNVVFIPVIGSDTIAQGLVWRKNVQNDLLFQLVSNLQKRRGLPRK